MIVNKVAMVKGFRFDDQSLTILLRFNDFNEMPIKIR